MPEPADPAAPAAGAGRQLQQLIVTICALYGRGERPAIAVSSLVRLLTELDVEEGAARSALSRLKKRGVLVSDRVRGGAAYRLDPGLEEVFEEGDERIFAPRRADPGDRWVLAAFSVPESKRHLRHRLRKVLTGRGFGTVGPGLWVAPELVLPHLHHELEREGLAEFVELFAADLLDADVRAKVAQWWDLDVLAERYAGFIATFAPVRERWLGSPEARRPVAAAGSAQRGTDDEAFADYVRLLTAWRRLPYLDPGLPTAYLPEDWAGTSAGELFVALHERLAEPARRHAVKVLDGG